MAKRKRCIPPDHAADAADPSSSVVDVRAILQGLDTTAPTYAQKYDSWMNLLRTLATVPGLLRNVPKTWVPFLRYVGCAVVNCINWFDTCEAGAWDELYRAFAERGNADVRRVVEIAAAARPELVDALFRYDTEWCNLEHAPRRHHTEELLVTTNNSFFRPEFRWYREELMRTYRPEGPRNLCIVPCSADKPYPSLVHREVKTMLGDTWQLMVATGVLGLVPESMWDDAPRYDAGTPNQFMVKDLATWFLSTRSQYFRRIVVYSDFYASSFHAAYLSLPASVRNTVPPIDYVFGTHDRVGYENLLFEVNLRRLASIASPAAYEKKGGLAFDVETAYGREPDRHTGPR